MCVALLFMLPNHYLLTFVEYHFIPSRKSYGKQILFYACFCSPTKSQFNYKGLKRLLYIHEHNQKTKILPRPQKARNLSVIFEKLALGLPYLGLVKISKGYIECASRQYSLLILTDISENLGTSQSSSPSNFQSIQCTWYQSFYSS